MNAGDFPKTTDIVLIGGGHTHALVLRSWGMNPLAGARITLINPGPTAPYSGMLPGHIAGHYDRDALDIDLVRLARFAGARLVLGAAEALDPVAREIHVPGRPPIGFDLCSIDIGITSAMPDLPGFQEHAIPAKPLGPFATSWQRFLESDGKAEPAVIGGGVAGAEIAMAMAYALKARGRAYRLALCDNASVLSAVAPSARRKLLRRIEALGITLHQNVEISALEHDGIKLADGTRIDANFIVGAAGARPYGWLSETGLALEDGFVSVDETLRSSDPAIFAVGDCAHLRHDPRPKAGVYAVRQAPVLHHNLRALAAGHSLKTYKPQKDYLKLISMGEKSALGERFGVACSGSVMWRWKDRIDQRFMDRFRNLPKMPAARLPEDRTTGLSDLLGDKPLCGGCGAKVGRTVLRAHITPDEPLQRADIALLPGDDAALLKSGDARQVITTDHLRAFVEDPYVMARIAAIHALGDVWAMGAAPQAALATIILPRMSSALQERTLAEITAAARTVFRDAGAEIVGGHTTMGAELTIGFTVTGLCDGAPITLGGAKPGDILLLTKPIGSGVLMAAEMQLEAKGIWVKSALDHMTRAQSDAAHILRAAHAMTDVTGFGLAGHLMGLCEASKVRASIDLGKIPLLDGALALSERGIRSTLYPDNRALAPWLPSDPRTDLLFDPQTAGGLLAAVAPDAASATLQALRDGGHPAEAIGRIDSGAPYVEVEPV